MSLLHTYRHLFHTRALMPHLYKGFATEDAPLHYPPGLEVEPTHQEISLALDIPAQTARGYVATTLTARTPRSTLKLDAVDLEIESVSDPEDPKLSWRHDGTHLTITWSSPLKKEEQRVLTIHYGVSHPTAGIYFSSQSEHHPEDAEYAATDHEPERARHWLPCIDSPQIRCSLLFKLRAKQDYTILANGARLGETLHDDGTKTVEWALKEPCPSYLVCFALGRFIQAEDGTFASKSPAAPGRYDTVPIAYYGAHTQTPENLLRTFGRTEKMMHWLTERLGQKGFVYPKYYQFALDGISGAMENISLVSWSGALVLDETLASEWTYLLDLINVHEMAHSYFGDALGCRDFSHAWLKESWATYIEQCWLEFDKGQDHATYAFYTHCHHYFGESSDRYARAIVTNQYDSPWELFDAHLYPGGAARLHMLRCLLGEDTFWPAIHDYVDTFLHRTVETHDFRAVLERHSGRSLGRFFDQWFHSPGFPDLKASFEWDAADRTARFTLEQTQSQPPFFLDLDLGWVQDGILHTRQVQLTKQKHQFSYHLPQKPQQVRIDPFNRTVIRLEFNPGKDLLLTQLTQAPDVVGRILAGQQLLKKGIASHVNAIGDAWPHEPFFGVRIEWAKALSQASSHHALSLLLALLESEQDPMVLPHLLRAIASYKDPVVRSPITSLLKRKDLGYHAQADAYKALGALGQDAPLELLQKAALTPAYSHFAQAGALEALALSRQPQALETLTAALDPATALPHATRAAAARALGLLAIFLPPAPRAQALDRLTRALRDPQHTVRDAAAKGLLRAGATQARPQLEAYKSTLPHQDQVLLQAELKKLKAPQDSVAAALEAKVDSLQRTLRDLAERFDRLENSEP